MFRADLSRAPPREGGGLVRLASGPSRRKTLSMKPGPTPQSAENDVPREDTNGRVQPVRAWFVWLDPSDLSVRVGQLATLVGGPFREGTLVGKAVEAGQYFSGPRFMDREAASWLRPLDRSARALELGGVETCLRGNLALGSRGGRGGRGFRARVGFFLGGRSLPRACPPLPGGDDLWLGHAVHPPCLPSASNIHDIRRAKVAGFIAAGECAGQPQAGGSVSPVLGGGGRLTQSSMTRPGVATPTSPG